MGTTRRAVLGGALMGALAGVAAFRSLAAASGRGEAVLYAYPGARAGTTVLAARWSQGPGGLARIHAGSRSWDLQVADREAAVVEVPNELLAGGKGIWAEKLMRAELDTELDRRFSRPWSRRMTLSRGCITRAHLPGIEVSCSSR